MINVYGHIHKFSSILLFFPTFMFRHEQNFLWNFWQSLLKVMADDSVRVTKAIRTLLDCSSKREQESTLHDFPSENLKELIFDNYGSHLVEASPCFYCHFILGQKLLILS